MTATRTHSTKDVATAFGIAPVTVRLWASQGRIPCSKTLGGHRRFDLDEVRRTTGLIPVHGEPDTFPLTPDYRFNPSATAERIDDGLHNPEYETRGHAFREDACLRAIIDLRDTLRRVSPEKLSLVVADPPALAGDSRWDAFVAAVVEDEGERKGAPVPRWTDDPRRFVKPRWYLSEIYNIKARRHWELAHTCKAYLRHGVVAAEEDLESV